MQQLLKTHKNNFHDAALKLLETMHKNELDLGYGEPPLYARPVAVSLAEAHIAAGKYEDVIKTYKDYLERFPKSVIYIVACTNYI